MFEFAFRSRLYYFGVLIQSNTKLTATERLNLRGKKQTCFVMEIYKVTPAWFAGLCISIINHSVWLDA